MDYNLHQMDILTPTIPFIIWLQSFHFLTPSMQLFSFLGSTYFYLFALPLLYWCVNRRVALDMGFLVLGNAIINNLIKVLFALPRPYWISPSVHQLAHESGFGLPSGHAQGAILFWLFLALQVPAKRRPLAIVGALILSGLIGLSRIYLAVHFPADVIVGFAVGLLVLGIYLKFEEVFRAWYFLQPAIRKITLAALCVFVTLLCFAIFIHLRHTQKFPPFDAEALSWISIISYTGAIFGLVIGMVNRRPTVQIPRNVVTLILRILAGLAVLIALWFGLAKLTAGSEIILTLCLRFFRYAIVSWWIIDGAPRLFAIWEKRIVANI
jgi:membrane-associated phospholipid phosphatase